MPEHFLLNMDFDERYQSMTDDELLNVAGNSQHLTPEARNSLDGELSRRRLRIRTPDGLWAVTVPLTRAWNTRKVGLGGAAD
jgi:hypothetical protein